MLEYRKFLSSSSTVLITIVVISLVLRVWNMQSWPLMIDEAHYANQAIDVLNGNKKIYDPVIISYQGPLAIYLMLPSILIFGKSLFFMRLPFVVFGVLSVVLLYLIVKRIYDTNVALLSAAILAIAPSEILNSNLAIEISYITFSTLLILNLFLKYSKSKRITFLFLIGFFSGFAMLGNIVFGLFLFAFLILLPVNPVLPLRKLISSLSPYRIIIFLLAFLLGSFPLLFWNFNNGFSTLSYLVDNIQTTHYGNSILNLKQNIENGYLNLQSYLNEWHRFHFTFNIYPQWDFLQVFILSSIAFIVFPICFRSRPEVRNTLGKNIYLLLLFLVCFLLLSTITISVFSEYEDSILIPLISIIISWTTFTVFRLAKTNSYIIIILFVFSFIIIIENFLINENANLNSIIGDPCNIAIQNITNYFLNSSGKSLVFDTNRYAEFYKFYTGSPNVHALIFSDPKNNNISSWNNFIDNQNSEFIFMNSKCISDLPGGNSIYQNFSDFVSKRNKTLELMYQISPNNIEILNVTKIV